MSLGEKLVRIYFNLVYNRVYDYATAKLDCYQKLQQKCIGGLDLRDNDRVLCVGVGTGNEIAHIWQSNPMVNITGVDYSSKALQRLRKKVSRLGKIIETEVMDARYLQFPSDSFDKVVCIHVMDFFGEVGDATSEIIRVLKDGGQFVITYPSEKEGAKLGNTILKDSFHSNFYSGNHIVGFFKFMTQLTLGSVYLPLVLRQRRHYSHYELKTMFTELNSGDIQIEENPAYQDFIVFGRK